MYSPEIAVIIMIIFFQVKHFQIFKIKVYCRKFGNKVLKHINYLSKT